MYLFVCLNFAQAMNKYELVIATPYYQCLLKSATRLAAVKCKCKFTVLVFDNRIRAGKYKVPEKLMNEFL